MSITGGFGMSVDVQTGAVRRWVMGRDGVRRWADTGDPCDADQLAGAEAAGKISPHFAPCGRRSGTCGKDMQQCGRDGCGAELIATTPCAQCGMDDGQHKLQCSYGGGGGLSLPAVRATHPVPSRLLTPRDWQAEAIAFAADNLGTPEGRRALVEAKRYGALADEIERLQQAQFSACGGTGKREGG